MMMKLARKVGKLGRTVRTEIHEQNISRQYQQIMLIDLSW